MDNGGYIRADGGLGVGVAPSSTNVINVSVNQNARTALAISNTTSGTAAQSAVFLTTDSSAGLSLFAYSNGFTSSGLAIPNTGLLAANSSMSGGLNIATQAAGAPLKFHTVSTFAGRVDSNQNLVWGYDANAVLMSATTPSVQFHTSGAASGAFSLVHWGATANANIGNVLMLARSGSSTIGTNTILASGNTAGRVAVLGANGTTFDVGAEVRWIVDGTPGASNDMPMREDHFTRADGASALNTNPVLSLGSNNRVTVNSALNLYVGTVSNPLPAAPTISAAQGDLTYISNAFGTGYPGLGHHDGSNWKYSAEDEINTSHTPTLALATPGTSTFTYTVQSFKFWRSGKRVNFDVEVTCSTWAIGTGTGNLRLSLPHTVRNSAPLSLCTARINGAGFAALRGVVCHATPILNAAYLELQTQAANAEPVTITGALMTTASALTVRVQGSYEIA
jgi:hypothetical protein